jgi:NAD(P)-dependent dehydrogenase (short-subunit alcohol dehydrogenase family)
MPEGQLENVMGRIYGKVAIVTGAGRGIGRGIALRFGQEGAKVVVVSRGEESVGKVVSAIRGSGGTAAGVSIDVGDRTQVNRMVEEATRTFGRVDILVNNAQSWGRPGKNAGTPSLVGVETYPEDEWDYTFQTGVKASLYSMQAIYPGMKARGWGRIVNFGSPAAQRSNPLTVAYNANKEAIRALSCTAALEWAKYGITVNVISPTIATDAMRATFEARAGGDPDELARIDERIAALSPTGRMGTPEDAGALATFICSDEASYITGMTFMLDGGKSLG